MPTESLDQVDAPEVDVQFASQLQAAAAAGSIQIDAAGIVRDFSRPQREQFAPSLGLECAVWDALPSSVKRKMCAARADDHVRHEGSRRL